MKALKGTTRLLRLSLRIDRIKIPLWILLTVSIIAVSLPQLLDAYSSKAQQYQYAAATAPSAVTRLLSGAITGPSIGEITVIETFFLVALMLSLMNIFMITRHNRKNEETGRSELIGSMNVGRQAMLTSSLFLALIVNASCSVLIYLVFLGFDYPANGAAIFSVGFGLIGMTFACVSAVTSQLFENTRAASGAASLVFGIAFLLRGLGDAFGKVNADGMSVTTNLLSYASPLGWATNAKPFAANNWWMFIPFIFAIGGLITAAYILLDRRDIGSSIFTPKLGRSHAAPWVMSRFGLVWRTSRTVFISWAISFVLFGATMGAIAEEFKDLISGNEEMKKLLETLGGGNNPVDLMYSAIFTIAAIAIAGFAFQVLTRMNSEETSGRLELMLSTKVDRVRWALGYILYALGGAVIILFLTGLVAGAVDGIINTGFIDKSLRLGGSILVYVPAVAIMIGAGVLLFGRVPKYFVMMVWGILGATLLMFQLGTLLHLPQWLLDISPYTHTPGVPSAQVQFAPLLYQSLVALVLLAVGLWSFANRDITTE